MRHVAKKSKVVLSSCRAIEREASGIRCCWCSERKRRCSEHRQRGERRQSGQKRKHCLVRAKRASKASNDFVLVPFELGKFQFANQISQSNLSALIKLLNAVLKRRKEI